MPGTKLGSYEVLSQIGAGGMSEVYRARDPNVAIKVLPEAFARAERLAGEKVRAALLSAAAVSEIALGYENMYPREPRQLAAESKNRQISVAGGSSVRSP